MSNISIHLRLDALFEKGPLLVRSSLISLAYLFSLGSFFSFLAIRS